MKSTASAEQPGDRRGDPDPRLLPARTPGELNALAIDGLSTPELYTALGHALGDLATRFERFARIVTALEKRGEDMTKFRSGLGLYLPLVASGAVAAEVVVKFAGQPMLLKAVTALPVEQQRELGGTDATVLVVEKDGKTFTHRLKPPHCLTAAEVKQVFDTAGRFVRSETEQVAYLQPRQLPKTVRGGKSIRLSTDRGLFYVGKEFAPTDEVIDTLRRAGLV